MNLLFKLLTILFAFNLIYSDDKTLFEMDLEKDGLAKFSELKASNTAQVSKDSKTQEDIVTFDGLSRYGGMLTKEWLESSTGWYHLKVKFRGIKDKRTGAFIGYISKDNDSIIHSIAMDQDQLMDDYQLFIFDNYDNEWHDYEAYFKGGTGIKLLLEKGNYYGLTEDLDAAFKDLEVEAQEFSSECPGDDGELKQNYFSQLFSTSNFTGKIQQKCTLDSDREKVTLEVKFPTTQIPCIKTQLYGIDNNTEVMGSLVPTRTVQEINNEKIETYTFSFTANDLQAFECYVSEVDCTKDSVTQTCKRYECDFEIHFYVEDSTKSFATNKDEFDYSKINNASIFKSMFMVQTYSDSGKFFNSMIQLPSIDKPCAGRCQLTEEIILSLYVKNAKGQWLPKDSAFTVVWGDDIDFKITCNPSNYILSFLDIFLIDEVNEKAISLGFDFLKNLDNSKQGEMTFTMPMSAEAGLKEGDPFNFEFLIILEEVTTRLRRRTLGAVFKSEDLPPAALSNNKNLFNFGQCTTEQSCISSSCSGSDICICKDTASCAIIEKCNMTNCTCSQITDITKRCELIECVENYGCQNCGCGVYGVSKVINSDETVDSNGNTVSGDSQDSSPTSSSASNSNTNDKFGSKLAIGIIALLILLIFY